MNTKKGALSQKAILRKIAADCSYRTDRVARLADIHPTLVYIYSNFVDTANAAEGGTPDLIYNIEWLRRQGLVKLAYYAVEVDGKEKREPGLGLTDEGVACVKDLERSWLSKAIEKQPVTFIQVMITVGVMFWSGALTVWAWHLQQQQNSLSKVQQQVTTTSSSATHP